MFYFVSVMIDEVVFEVVGCKGGIMVEGFM